MDLAQFFAQIPDPRRGNSIRYPLPATLWMLFAAIASGCVGQRSMARFCKSNASFFQTFFQLKHGTPSHVSVSKLLARLDKAAVLRAFQACASPALQPGDWVAGDGQALRATVEQAQDAEQTYCALVSLYCQRTGLTRAVLDYTSHKAHEGEVVRLLVESLPERGLIVTLDALHCQKKQPPPS